MKNNCNLELRLRPSTEDTDPFSSFSSDDVFSVHQHAATEVSIKRPEQQEVTIFDNGKVSVSEVTELQARAIIMLASRDIVHEGTSRTSYLGSPKVVCNKYPAEFSMKRSLQRFFQKRQQRIQHASPYGHHQPHGFCNEKR